MTLSKQQYRGGPRKQDREKSKQFSHQLLAEYRGGMSYRQLAEKYGMAYTPVWKRCERAREEEERTL